MDGAQAFATTAADVPIADRLFYTRVDSAARIVRSNAATLELLRTTADALTGTLHQDRHHPAMPRAVLHHLLSQLQAGRLTTAYIARRDADDALSYVVTMMAPCPGGFLVMGFHPRLAMLERVKQVYAQVCQIEAQPEHDPAQAVASLEAGLVGDDFHNIDEYSVGMFARELEEWSLARGRPYLAPTRALKRIFSAVVQIEVHIDAISAVFERTSQVPDNMRLQANILEGQNGPISVVSDNHRLLTHQMRRVLTQLNDLSKHGVRDVAATGLHAAAAQLYREVLVQDSDGTAPEHAEEIALLQAESRRLDTAVAHRLREITGSAQRLSQICKDLRRQLTGLEMSRMMCEIERSKLNRPAEGLSSIVQALGTAQSHLDTEVTGIEAALRVVMRGAEQIAVARAAGLVPVSRH